MRNKKKYVEWFRFKRVPHHDDVIVYTNGKLRLQNVIMKWELREMQLYTKEGRFGLWIARNVTSFSNPFVKALENAVDKQILDD